MIFRSDTSIFVHFCAKVKCFCSLLCKFSFSLLLFIVHLFSFSVHFVYKQIFLFFVRFSSPQNIGIPEYNFRNVMQIAFFADASPGCFVLHKPAFQPTRKCCAGCLIFFFSKLDVTHSRTRLVPEIDGVHRKFQHRNHRTAGFFQFSCCLFQFFFQCRNRFMSGRTLRLILDSRVEQRVSIIRMAEHFLLINHIGIPPVENGAFRGFCHIGNKFSTPVA